MIITIIFTVLSALCLIYYLTMISYAGIGTSFAPAWLVAFVFFVLIAVFQFLDCRKIITVLPWVRRIVWGMIICLFGLFVMLEGMIISGMVSKPEKNLDYIIVLGAQVRGNVPSKSLYRRIEKAAEYLKDNPDTIAIVSGGKGSGENISEAECMYEYLVDMGVKCDRIILEDKSTSTEENIEFSTRIIKELSHEDVKVGVITNDFHIFRTVCICKAKELEVVGIPAKSDEVLLLNYMVREAFGLVEHKLRGII